MRPEVINTMTNEFDVLEAKKLLEVYKNKGSTEKEKFLAELISINAHFCNRSMFNTKLLLENNYSKQTLSDVITDLGYTLEYNSNNTIINSCNGSKDNTPIIVISK